MPGEALRIALRLALLQVLFASHRLLPLPDSPALFFALPLPEVLWAGALLYRLRSATARPPLRGPRGTLRRPHRVLRTAETIALASLLALLFVYNGGEIFYRYFYLDHFAIRTDLALIPGLARMLFPSLAWPETLLAVVAYLALAALLAGVSSLLAKALMLGGGSAQKPQEPENTIAARLVDPKRTNTGKGLMAQRGLIVPMGPAFPMGLVLSGAVILLAFPDQTPSYRMV
jgi:hypothetical protein